MELCFFLFYPFHLPFCALYVYVYSVLLRSVHFLCNCNILINFISTFDCSFYNSLHLAAITMWKLLTFSRILSCNIFSRSFYYQSSISTSKFLPALRRDANLSSLPRKSLAFLFRLATRVVRARAKFLCKYAQNRRPKWKMHARPWAQIQRKRS